MRRLLQVVTDTDRRGSQQFALDLQPALRQRGWDVQTVALAPGSSGAAHLPLETLGPARRSPTTLRALRRRMHQADIVIAHGSTTLPACAIAGAGLATPFLYRGIGDPLYWASNRSRRLRTRVFLGRAAGVSALWPAAGAALRTHLGVAPERLRIIPNAVPQERCPVATEARRRSAREVLGVPHDAPLALFVGALAPEKDVATLVRAIATLDTWQLAMVGDGPLREDLRRLAENHAPGRVFMPGPSEDVAGLLPAADVMCLPSLSEGMPGILIEASLVGVPSVATAVGGVAEIVTPETGWLVRPGDPDALAQALVETCARRDQLGAAARRRCLEHFEIGPVAARWDDFLRDTLEAR